MYDTDTRAHFVVFIAAVAAASFKCLSICLCVGTFYWKFDKFRLQIDKIVGVFVCSKDTQRHFSGPHTYTDTIKLIDQ